MPLRPAVWKASQDLLDPGEEIHYLLPVTSLLAARVGGMAPFILAVTDKRIALLACRWMRRNVPRSVWASYPRRVQLGPVETGPTGGPTFSIGRSMFEIDEEYASVINAADAEIGDGEFLPPDPFPER